MHAKSRWRRHMKKPIRRARRFQKRRRKGKGKGRHVAAPAFMAGSEFHQGVPGGRRARGGCPWPDRSLIGLVFARKWALRARIWTRFHVSVFGFGRDVDFGGPGPSRRIRPGPPNRPRCGHGPLARSTSWRDRFELSTRARPNMIVRIHAGFGTPATQESTPRFEMAGAAVPTGAVLGPAPHRFGGFRHPPWHGNMRCIATPCARRGLNPKPRGEGPQESN